MAGNQGYYTLGFYVDTVAPVVSNLALSGTFKGSTTYTVAAWDFARGYPPTGAGNMGSNSGSFTVDTNS